MEFLSSIFDGISNTFTQGANVNRMQSEERLTKLALQDAAQQRLFDQATGRQLTTLGLKQQEARLVQILIIGAVATFMLIIFLKVWR